MVVVFAPGSALSGEFEQHVAAMTASGRAAVLVVFTSVADTATIDRFTRAGADLCVVAPTPEELFAAVERARVRHRAHATEPATTREGASSADDAVLDALWRKRSGARGITTGHAIATA